MSSKPYFRASIVSVALACALFASLPALAAPVTLFSASDFYIPRPVSASDQEGVRRLLIEFDLAAEGHADLIGQECVFEVSAFNGDSVHTGNYAVIATNGSETDVYNTENEPNVETTRLEDASHILGPTVSLYNVMLRDPNDTIGTSVDFTVVVDCEPSAVTTTTAPTTTTTEPATTTTTAPTSTTTGPLTTTSSVLGTTTTSTPGETTSTTTPAVSVDTLPFTGPPAQTAGVAMAAIALLMLGSGALMAARDR